MTEITGYAAVFGRETVIAGAFRERILRGAFAETLKRNDIRGAFNHNPDMILGRNTAKTVELWEDAIGLRYKITVNDRDPMALGVAARIERRDVTGSSFWFAVDSPDDEEWQIDGPKELPLRTLKKLRLLDIGPVSYPAYEMTSTNVVTRTDDGIAELQRCRKELERAKAWREPQLTRRRSIGVRVVAGSGLNRSPIEFQRPIAGPTAPRYGGRRRCAQI